MFTPVTKAEQLTIVNPEGSIAICSLWTPQESIVRDLEKVPQRLRDLVCCIGNLYNPKRGITPLLVNLLANPQIKLLIVTGADLNGGALAVWMATTGLARDNVDQAVTPEMQKTLCSHTYTILLSSEKIDEYLVTAENILNGMHNDSLRPKIVVDIPEPQAETIHPAQDNGFSIRAKTVEEGYVKLLHEIMTYGKGLESGYNSEHIEVMNLMVTITGEIEEPSIATIPSWISAHVPILATENSWAAYCSTVLFPTLYDHDKALSGDVKYTYGDRLRWWFGVDQIQQIVEKLRKEQESKSAVAVLWDPKHDNTHSGSPCLNHLWFRIREGRLHMTAVIRSNDMYSAWPANAYSLRKVQTQMRGEVSADLLVGDLTIISESAHIYAHSYRDAEDIVARHYGRQMRLARARYDDPKGSFLVSLSEDSDGPFMIVEHNAPDGSFVEVFEEWDAATMMRALANANAVTDLYHALYLGGELQKAEMALKNPDLIFVQDRPLTTRQGSVV